ncbi:MAG: transposase [SAR324 cluster bacterium]|nr:transposase [SAR324 cluster bacterium]
MTQKQIRRSYSNEFKHNAVALSEHPGRQVSEVAEKLGITEQILRVGGASIAEGESCPFQATVVRHSTKSRPGFWNWRSNCAMSRWSETF